MQPLFFLCIVLGKARKARAVRFARETKTSALVSWLHLVCQSVLLLTSRCAVVASGGNLPTPCKMGASNPHVNTPSPSSLPSGTPPTAALVSDEPVTTQRVFGYPNTGRVNHNTFCITFPKSLNPNLFDAQHGGRRCAESDRHFYREPFYFSILNGSTLPAVTS